MKDYMVAAVLAAPGRVELVRSTIPRPGSGEIVVKMEGCGVCPSNIPMWEGRPWFEYPTPPGVPGHEGWGRVDSVGEEVSGFSPGDRVAVLSSNAFAEYCAVPSACAVALPATLDETPFPGEPIGCAVNVFARSDIRPGHTVAVLGAGFLGIIVSALAARAGAFVTAASRRPIALRTAKLHGVRETVLLEQGCDPSRSFREIAGEGGWDRVIEATGHQAPLDLAGEIVAERGKLVIAGYHQEPRQINLQQWNWKGIDVINAHERDTAVYVSGIREGIEIVASGVVRLSELLTHCFALDELDRAYRTLIDRPEDFIKGTVRIGNGIRR